MNLLYSLTTYPPSVGGAQFHQHSIAQQLQRMGCQIQIASYWDHNRNDWLLGTTICTEEPNMYEIDGIPVNIFLAYVLLNLERI